MTHPHAEVVFGGTFDPVHEGHLAIARALVHQLNVVVRFVPVFKPGHRAPCQADAFHRLAMLELALEAEEGMLIDPYEFTVRDTVPTIRLLRHLRSELPSTIPLFFVMGEDAYADMPKWVESEKILDLAHVIVIPRAISKSDHVLSREIPHLAKIDDNMEPAGRVFQLSFQKVATSATMIRAQLASGEREVALPQCVGEYIERQNLYRTLQNGAFDI